MTEQLKGNLEQIDIEKLVSLLLKAKHSGCLVIKSGQKEGRIYFKQGKLCAAQTKNKRGYNALLEIFLFKEGEFAFDPNVHLEVVHFKEETLTLLQKVEQDLSIVSNLDQKITLVPAERPVSLAPKEWMVIALTHRGLNLSQIVQMANIELGELIPIMKRLKNEGLIELIKVGKAEEAVEKKEKEKEKGKIVPPLFWKALRTELAAIIGPIAEAVIEDEIEELEESKESFPYHKAPILVEKISQEIEDPHERITFQKHMLEVLKKL